MTPKEKAKELVERFGYTEPIHDMDIITIHTNKMAKKHALICVNESLKIVDSIRFNNDVSDDTEAIYLIKVKQEINKL